MSADLKQNLKATNDTTAIATSKQDSAMLIIFFDKKCVVHSEIVPEGQTVNGSFYVVVLRRLNRRVKRVQPEIADNWKLHHDNASSYTSFMVTDQFSSLPRVLILSLRFFLSLKVKTNPKECHCKTLEAVKRSGLKL